MNFKAVFRLVGTALKFEALFLLIPLAASIGGPDTHSFVITIVLCGITSIILSRLKRDDGKYRTRDSFASAALVWLACSFFGALPFYLSGYFASFADCLFESVSGFTTTGATILQDIEILPRGIMLWRSMTHWIGGMGVLVFVMAFSPSGGASTVNLLKAESTGPDPSKIVPKIKDTARILYLIYFVMTILLIVLLRAVGMSWFDSVIHAVGAAGTGGFSNRNLSMGAFDNVQAEIIISIFMLLFGVNFTLFYHLIKRNYKLVRNNEELLFYAGIVIFSVAVITISITDFYGSIPTALRHSLFQVSSVITTTGYSSTDFNIWPVLGRLCLVFLMFTGCCAGSTGGGIKLIRILILFKAVKREVYKIIHPNVVKPLKCGDKNLDNSEINGISLFFFIYMTMILIGSLLISLENTDIVTSVTSVIACVGNIGPGLGLVGPMGNFALFSAPSKLLLSFLMLAGRLEIYPMLVLFSPSLWHKSTVS